MSRRATINRKKRNKGNSQLSMPPEKTKKSLWQWLKLLSPTGKLAAGFGIILTIFGAYFPFYPKISVTSSYSLDPSTPFSTKFDIRNDSVLKVTEIKPICKRVTVKMVGGGGIDGEKGSIQTAQPPIPYLESGESTSFILPIAYIKFGAPIEYAEVTVSITYSHLFLPLPPREKLTRFVTEKGVDGILHWANKAISE
jgi:hypothetical protein